MTWLTKFIAATTSAGQLEGEGRAEYQRVFDHMIGNYLAISSAAGSVR